MEGPRRPLRVEFRSAEPLEKDHRTAATRALPYSSRTRFGLDGTGTAASGYRQALLAEWQQSFAAAVGEKAEEADAYKAVWQHMQKKAAQKLVSSDGHHFLFAAVGVILPAECYLVIGEVDDPVIGDGNTMGVAGQVMQHVLGAAERGLSVHDPVLTEERTKKGTEGSFVRKWLEAAGENKLAFPKRPLQPCRELATEDAAEHIHRQEECIAWMNPLLVIERKTTGRNHAMNMGMVPSSRTIP